MAVSVEEIDVLHDLEEERRQQRYMDIIGHTTDHMYLDDWSVEICRKVRDQHIEIVKFGFLTEQELALNRIESNHNMYKYNPKTRLYNVPFIKIGEPCAICLEPMISRKNSYYTECGHKMHKTCITNYYNSTYNNKKHGYSENWKIRCPICRASLTKCLWLEERYLTNPFLKRAAKWNVVYDDYPEFFNHRVIECAGCECTNGCDNVCGSRHKLGCVHCYRWRNFTLDDLVYHHMLCKHDVERQRQEDEKKEKMRGCGGQLKRMLGIIFGRIAL